MTDRRPVRADVVSMGNAVARRNLHVQQTLSGVLAHPDDTVLDIGAGSLRKSSLMSTGRYVATDLRELPGLDAVADATRLPCRSGSIKAVLGLELLEHVPRPALVLEEAARVLAEDGVAMFSTPAVFPRHDIYDYWRFTPMGLKELARNHFATVDVITFGHTFETLAVVAGYYLQLAAHRTWRPLERALPRLEALGKRLDDRIPWASSEDGLHTLQSDLLLVARGPRS